jgi:Na+-transporting NADH:ubiquinone oxidoreductase subunit B
VFIATDPTTSPVTSQGRWIYGALVGALIVAMRSFDEAQPDGTLPAILIASLLVPVIDHLVLRRQLRRYREGKTL